MAVQILTETMKMLMIAALLLQVYSAVIRQGRSFTPMVILSYLIPIGAAIVSVFLKYNSEHTWATTLWNTGLFWAFIVILRNQRKYDLKIARDAAERKKLLIIFAPLFLIFGIIGVLIGYTAPLDHT